MRLSCKCLPACHPEVLLCSLERVNQRVYETDTKQLKIRVYIDNKRAPYTKVFT